MRPKTYNSFEKYHPITNLIYFSAVLIFTMFTSNPYMVGISLAGALLYLYILYGMKTVFKLSGGVFFVALFVAVINLLFNHRGVTILFYLENGNPITLEAAVYGMFQGIRLGAAVLWCFCINAVFTGDKYMYIFGKIIPHSSLVISMALGFVPRFMDNLRRMNEAQKALKGFAKENLTDKLKNKIHLFGMMITLSMESAVITSDSMKQRGYGTGKRTAFALYSFEKKDIYAVLFMVLAAAVNIYGYVTDRLNFYYYPMILGGTTDIPSLLAYILFGITVVMPMLIELKEKLKTYENI